MKAFLLAAGLGTRLKPLTDTLPKALIPVHGVAMLDRIAGVLVRGGASGLALNTHHLPHVVERHLSMRDGVGHFAAYPGIGVHLFFEPTLLGTGGALLNVASFWGVTPLLVWNADILADLDPAALAADHMQHPDALGTLAVSGRAATSQLLVDAQGILCGIASPRRNDHRTVRKPQGDLTPRAFHGISVFSPRLRAEMSRRHPAGGAFDLIEILLDVAAHGGLIRAYDTGTTFWGSTGTPKELQILEEGLTAHPDVLRKWGP